LERRNDRPLSVVLGWWRSGDLRRRPTGRRNQAGQLTTHLTGGRQARLFLLDGNVLDLATTHATVCQLFYTGRSAAAVETLEVVHI